VDLQMVTVLVGHYRPWTNISRTDSRRRGRRGSAFVTLARVRLIRAETVHGW